MQFVLGGHLYCEGGGDAGQRCIRYHTTDITFAFMPSGNGGENRLRIRNNQDLGVVHLLSPSGSPVRYVLKIHFFIESGQKMIQFKIQFKTKSKIFIQKNIHSIESRIFNRIIHS